MIHVDDTGRAPAGHHMGYDNRMLNELPSIDLPFLHFYEWETKSITYGHFIDPWALIDKKKCDELGFDCARRPTGGGLLFHYADFSFSLFLPAACPKISSNTLENYAQINSCVMRALDLTLSLEDSTLYTHASSSRPTFCMASITQYDLLFKGRKIGGAAQRRTKKGLLHQTSIFLGVPNWDEISLLVSTESAALMKESSEFVLGSTPSQDIRKRLQNNIIKSVDQWIQDR